MSGKATGEAEAMSLRQAQLWSCEGLPAAYQHQSPASRGPGMVGAFASWKSSVCSMELQRLTAASGFTAFLMTAVVVGPTRGCFWDIGGVIPRGLVYTALSSNLSTDFANIPISDLNLFMYKTPREVSVSPISPDWYKPIQVQPFKPQSRTSATSYHSVYKDLYRDLVKYFPKLLKHNIQTQHFLWLRSLTMLSKKGDSNILIWFVPSNLCGVIMTQVSFSKEFIDVLDSCPRGMSNPPVPE